MTAQKELHPSTVIGKQDLEVLSFMIAAKLNEFADKPMTAKEARVWLGVGKTKFLNMVNDGTIKAYPTGERADPMYIRSQIIDGIKNRKQS